MEKKVWAIYAISISSELPYEVVAITLNDEQCSKDAIAEAEKECPQYSEYFTNKEDWFVGAINLIVNKDNEHVLVQFRRILRNAGIVDKKHKPYMDAMMKHLLNLC